MRRILLETPYRAYSNLERMLQLAYMRAAQNDVIKKGGAPFSAYLQYGQPGVLDRESHLQLDTVSEAIKNFYDVYDAVAFYTDYGMPDEMRIALKSAFREEKEILEFKLGDWLDEHHLLAYYSPAAEAWGLTKDSQYILKNYYKKIERTDKPCISKKYTSRNEKIRMQAGQKET